MLHRQSQAFIQRSRHHWIAPPYPQNPEPNLPAWKASSNDFPASWSSGSSLRSRFIEPSTPWPDKTAIALPVNPNRCQHEETQSKSTGQSSNKLTVDFIIRHSPQNTLNRVPDLPYLGTRLL